MVRKRTIGPKAFAAITIGVAAVLGAFIFLYALAPPPSIRYGRLPFAPGLVSAAARPATEVPARETSAASSPAVPRQATAGAAARMQLVANYEKLPLSFEANQGQTDSEVKFMSHGPGYTLSLTPMDAAVSLMLSKTASLPARTGQVPTAAARPMRASALRIRRAGANPHPRIQDRDGLRGKSNYLLGNDPKKWRTNVPNYARVEYTDVYPGVNLFYYGHQGQLEDDFEVEPGANPRTIRSEISGGKKITLDRAGNAVLPLQAQTESVLYSFAGPPADGETPSGSLARDASGNLYGTTQQGGASNLGAVFKLHPNGDGTYTESLLYSFTNTGGDGETPVAGLVVDGSGNLYGTTQNGGSTNCTTGCGILFELHPNSDGTYTESVLHGFTGHPDGASPGALLIDASGNLYGTTLYGGTSTSATFCKTGCGTVFELANNSGTYTYSVLFSFTTNDFYGIDPGGNLAIDSSGNLYGTATVGGGSTASCALGCGTVFELANDSGSYVPSLLYSFTGAPDAELPVSGLISDPQGNLYGAAGGGASTACFASSACGAVFKLHPNGDGTYSESVLYSFTNGPDGSDPGAVLVIDALDNLYGITGVGGTLTTCMCGTVFKLHPNGDGTYSESVLYSFMGSPDGSVPGAGLVMDAFDNLYGNTAAGGTSTGCDLGPCGTVFEVASGMTASADLAVSASASPNPVAVNSTLTYTLTVTNNGPSGATGVTLTDTLPPGAGFQNATSSPGGTCTNGSGIVTCSIGSLASQATATVALTLTTPATAGSPSNTATVSGNQTDPNPSNNTATTVVNVTLPVNLSVVKTAPSVGTIGESLTYTVTVTNSSTANTATNATLTDPLPPGLNFQSYSTTQGTCTSPAVGSSGMVNCNLGTLAGGATATISLVVVPTVVNPALANTATITADQANSNPNNSSTATVNVQELSSVNVNVFERIRVRDTPGALDSAMVPVSETIHVTDTPTTAFPVPTLTITMTSLTVQGTEYLATFTVSNVGGATANNVSVTGAGLVTFEIVPVPPPLPPVVIPHTTNPTNPLPVGLGNIDAGSSVILKLSYPINFLDLARSRAVIQISGMFDGGSFGGNFKTTLP